MSEKNNKISSKQDKVKTRLGQRRLTKIQGGSVRKRTGRMLREIDSEESEVSCNSYKCGVDNFNENSQQFEQSQNNNNLNIESSTLGQSVNVKIINQRIKARERMAKKRADPNYAMKERARAREANARKREDPAFLQFERAKNRQMMALKRQDPEYASRERERARQIMALKRQNEDFANLERAMNRQRVALKRRDPEYRKSKK